MSKMPAGFKKGSTTNEKTFSIWKNVCINLSISVSSISLVC